MLPSLNEVSDSPLVDLIELAEGRTTVLTGADLDSGSYGSSHCGTKNYVIVTGKSTNCI